MPDELMGDVTTAGWLFTVALSLGGGTLLIALAAILGLPMVRGAVARRTGVVLGASALVALLGAVVVTVERGPIPLMSFDAAEYAGDLTLTVAYSSAMLLGLVGVAAAVLVSATIGTRSMDGAGGMLRLAAASTVVLVGTAAFVLGAARSAGPVDLGMHPPGTVFGSEVGATRLATAAFATDLVVAPSGEVFFAEHLAGRVGVLVPSAGGGWEARTFGEVPIPSDGRLFHIALHPEWPEEPYVYATAHEGSGAEQRLAVFRLRADGLTATEVEPVVRGLPTEDPRRGPEADHFGSALAACGEYLYLSVGDTDSPGPDDARPGRILMRAQLPHAAEGKILRYRFEGGDLIPGGPNGGDVPVFAMGFRNVFSMDCTEDDERVIAADNGFRGWDQIRIATAGSNHGWPLTDERVTMTPPVYDTGPRSAVAPTGVAQTAGADGPRIWFSTFHTNAIYRLVFEGESGTANGLELMHVASGAILSLADGADGCVYFTTADGIWRLNTAGCDGAGDAGATALLTGSAAEMFAVNCAPCHGRSAEGGGAPALTMETLTETDEYYMGRILGGVTGSPMPAWAAAGMSTEQARELVDYLRAER